MTCRRYATCWFCLSALTLCLTGRAAAEPNETPPGGTADEPPPARFLRVRRNADREPLAMETAIVRYVGPDGKGGKVAVDLIGAVHIAEKSYYEQLNRRFSQYEAVLYELVAPEGTRIPKGGVQRVGHPIGGLQRGMKTLLRLEFQLDCVDYTPRNFVHADMTPEQFAASMKRRGESFTQMFFRMLGQGLARQAKTPAANSNARLLAAFLSPDRGLQLKRMMAEEFEDMEATIGVLEAAGGSTIIAERNKKALSVLDQQIKAGKRRLAVFYGAGHLPDMERRLIEQFGLKRDGTEWLAAWSLADSPDRDP